MAPLRLSVKLKTPCGVARRHTTHLVMSPLAACFQASHEMPAQAKPVSADQLRAANVAEGSAVRSQRLLTGSLTLSRRPTACSARRREAGPGQKQSVREPGYTPG